MQEFGLFINNEWVKTQESFTDLNPATEEPLATFAVASKDDVDHAVRSAREAFDSGVWSGMPALERGRHLRRVAELLRERAEDFAVAETMDVGKPIVESRLFDVPMTADSLDYFASLIADMSGTAIPVGANALDYTVREPIGVIAAITPWNFPLALACRKLAPCLAAGNTAVIKPASLAPMTTVMLGDLFLEAGLPAGVVNIVTGPGGTTGSALLHNPGVDKLSFTGSTEIGRDVMAAAAEGVCACSLELGGKSPAVVLADARIEQTVAGILFGAFLNQGECCCAATRVLVDRSIHAELVEALVETTRRIKVGDPLEDDCRMGPMISAQQRQSVLDYIAAGRAEVGEPVLGGGVPAGLDRGYFLDCTIFDDVPPSSRIYREEIFGPVLTVTAFDGVDALVAAANDTAYGLAASIWTGDAAEGLRLSSSLKAGTVWVNVHNFVYSQAPYGGMKQSGVGRELGREGLEAYTEVKNVITWLGPGAFTWY